MAHKIRTRDQIEEGHVQQNNTFVFEVMPCRLINHKVRWSVTLTRGAGKRLCDMSQMMSAQVLDHSSSLLNLIGMHLLHVLEKLGAMITALDVECTVMSKGDTSVHSRPQADRLMAGQVLQELRGLCLQSRIDLCSLLQGGGLNCPWRKKENTIRIDVALKATQWAKVE